MALVNKPGSLIRQTMRKHNSSIFQIIRCISSSKLYVEGLSPSTTNSSLRKAFVPYGNVKEAQVSVKSNKASKNSGSSRFGYVIYSNTESASAAIKALDKKELHGRVVRVKYLEDLFENKPQKDRKSGVSHGSGFLEGFTWDIFDHIVSSKKDQDSDVAGQDVGGSDTCKGEGQSHNSGFTSGNMNANEDYGDLSDGYFDGESHKSDSAGGNRNASEDYGHRSSGYFDGEIQKSDPAGENNDSFFSGWGGGDNSEGFFSNFFSDDD